MIEKKAGILCTWLSASWNGLRDEYWLVHKIKI